MTITFTAETRPDAYTMTKTVVWALILLLSLAAGCASKSSEDHLVSAKTFLDESNPDAAIIELKNALQKSSEMAEARWLLGKTYLDTGDIDSAVKELQLARRFGWPADDVVPALARGLLAQRAYVRVRHLQPAELSPESGAQLMATQAIAEFAQGELEVANSLINQALAIEPDAIDIRLAHARILFGLNDLNGSLAVLSQLLSESPDFGPAWSLLGDLKIRQAQTNEALAAYTKAIKGPNGSVTDRVKRALVLLQLQDYDNASADAKVLLSRSPSDPGGNYIRGVLHYQSEEYADAILRLSNAEPAWQQFPLTLFFLGSAHFFEGNVNQAELYSSRFLDAVPGSVLGTRLLATVRLKLGKYSSAEALVAPLLEQDPEDEAAMQLLATALMKSGQINAGIAVLEQLIEVRPDSASALVALGAGLLATGDSGNAERKITAALELDPDLQQADVLLILKHLNTGNHVAAVAAARAYRQRHPTELLPKILLGRVFKISGDLESAQTSLEEALSISPADPSANHSLAQISIEQGDLQGARQRYEAVLAKHSRHLSTNIQLALLDAREDRIEAMVERLEKTLDAHPEALDPKLILARYYLSTGKAERVATLFSTLEPQQRRTPQALKLIAMSQISSARYQGAQSTLESVLLATPDTPETHHLLAMAAAGSGDSARSRAELEAALAIDENFIPSRVALARLDLGAQSLDSFRRHLNKLTELAADSPDVLQLRAAAAAEDDRHEEAIAHASRAYELAPATHSMLELAHHRKLAGEHSAALSLLQDWVAQHPGDHHSRLALADTLRARGDIGGAIAEYGAIIQRMPRNLVALTNLAWLLKQEDNPRARELSLTAIDLAPDAPQVLNTAAMVSYFAKDYGLAMRNIRRAIARDPNNLSYHYHNALINAGAGNKETAIAILEGLTASDEMFPERAEVETLLSQLSM